MRRAILLFVSLTALGASAWAQKPSATPAKKTEKPAATPSASPNKSAAGDLTNPAAPVTTEIYSDQAFFDSTKNMGIFTGHVKVNDPRFNLQSDKLTVYVTKGENQGLERAVAEGNVGVVRDRPDPNGGPPQRAIGRGEKANYIAATGDVELTGMPRVSQGMNTHIATSPETTMLINQSGQLTTHGPSRTEIRQEPKDENEDAEGEDKKQTDEQKKKEKPKKPVTHHG